MERNARLPQSAHQHQRQHAGKPYKIDFAFDGERRRIRRRVEERRARFFTVMEIIYIEQIKKITTCTVCRRLSFARSNGRISSIAAPVVPITLASSVPRASSPVFMTG